MHRRSKNVGLSWVTLALVAATTLAAPAARAQTPPAGGAPPSPDSSDEDHPGKPRSPAPDELGGHFLASASLSLLDPAGSIAAGRPFSSLASPGPSLGLAAGFGLGRAAVLQVSGSYAFLGAPSDCSGCKARGFDLGLGLVYHVAQGFAVDPWVSYGIAYRGATFDAADATTASGVRTDHYSAIDVARLALGADFYSIPSVGFGPFIEGDFGASIGRPDPDPGGSGYAVFQLGLRVALRPGRAAAVAAPAPKSARR